MVGIVLARGIGRDTNWGVLLHETFLGKGVTLLLGGMAIGWIAGPEGLAPIKGLFYDLFKGVLALFLLEMGLIVSHHIGELRRNGLFLLGTWKMHELQVSNVSPVVGLSMIWVYGVGYVVAVVMGTMNLRVLWRIVSGRITEEELVQVIETEGLADVEKQLRGQRA